jgi:hypothetical protein
MIYLCLLCLLPLVVEFVRNGGNTDIPRSPKVGP